MLSAGCSFGDSGENQGQLGTATPPDGSQIERVEKIDGQPATLITTDGRRIAFKEGKAWVGDTMALEMPGGRTEYYRTPSAIMAELSQVKVAYLIDDSDELIFFEGLQGEPCVDPNSGKLCWMAIACTNSKCAMKSGEYFAFREPGFSIDSDGKIIRPDPQFSPRPTTTRPCPTCGSRDYLVPYRPTEVVDRRKSLEDEGYVRACICVE